MVRQGEYPELPQSIFLAPSVRGENWGSPISVTSSGRLNLRGRQIVVDQQRRKKPH